MKFRPPIFFSVLIFLLLVPLFICAPSAVADNSPAVEANDEVPNVKLGNEYTKHRKARAGSQGSSSSSAAHGGESSIGRKILLYLPNRFLDLIDIFRVDVGIGPAAGGVVRITKYGQAGYRTFAPLSVRAGLMGRQPPLMVEESPEYGVGPSYVESKDREVGSMEVGAGVDLFVAGGYIGVDFYQIPDFFLGFFGVDYADDDLS